MVGRANLRVSRPILILTLVETLVIAVSIFVGLYLSWVDLSRGENLVSYLPSAILYTSTIVVMIFSVGLYNRQFWTKFGGMVVRLVTALVLSFIVLTVVFYTIPVLSIPRSILAVALLAVLPGLIAVRALVPLRELMDVRLTGIAVSDYQSFYESETGCVDLDAVKPSWFLFSNGFAGTRLHKWLKRTLDLAVSLVFLVLFLPLMLLAAIAVRLESPGPVFYRQQRIGFRGRTFTLFKFRSMCADAEKDGVPKWADRNDSRITRVGAVIRKTRIDELPQIFNVLMGDMSFVGPCPERAYFVDQLAAQLPFYADRHWVKPGITGWAQLNYQYGASVEDAKIKLQYDLYYVNYYGILLDIIVIIQTVRVVLWPSGVR